MLDRKLRANEVETELERLFLAHAEKACAGKPARK
jgi:hypothetical protein